MALFCAAIKIDKASLLRFPLSHVQVILYAISPSLSFEVAMHFVFLPISVFVIVLCVLLSLLILLVALISLSRWMFLLLPLISNPHYYWSKSSDW